MLIIISRTNIVLVPLILFFSLTHYYHKFYLQIVTICFVTQSDIACDSKSVADFSHASICLTLWPAMGSYL